MTDELNLVVNQSVVSVSDFEIKPDLLAAGEDHTCAIDADGAVWCWGTGNSGQLGTGQTVNRWQPFITDSLGVGRTAIDITAGGDHTCAVLDDGTVSCWGANAYGQLGDGTNTLRKSPTQTLPLGRPPVPRKPVPQQLTLPFHISAQADVLPVATSFAGFAAPKKVLRDGVLPPP